MGITAFLPVLGGMVVHLAQVAQSLLMFAQKIRYAPIGYFDLLRIYVNDIATEPYSSPIFLMAGERMEPASHQFFKGWMHHGTDRTRFG
jgi:hypothetical protein